jgi:hypothetical protein
MIYVLIPAGLRVSEQTINEERKERMNQKKKIIKQE